MKTNEEMLLEMTAALLGGAVKAHLDIDSCTPAVGNGSGDEGEGRREKRFWGLVCLRECGKSNE